MSGPLEGFRIIELAGVGPGPFAGMMLADMGAEVLRIDRASEVVPNAKLPFDFILRRGRRSVAIDMQKPEGAEAVLRLVEKADAIYEGFRPGVAERLGVGPDACLARNSRLVYGRMTGWGQDGPYAKVPGYDLNYIALSGALNTIGRADGPPVPPLNLVGDFGGGGMLLAYGIVCALLEASRSGRGQVVDAAMVDGSALLMAVFHSCMAVNQWRPERGTNIIDTGAPFYEVYETSDGLYMAVAANEPKFYAVLLDLLGLKDEPVLARQMDQAQWPEGKKVMATTFRTRTRAQWVGLFEGTSACVTPVLSLTEALDHPHNLARNTFMEQNGVRQPAPAPRFSRTPAVVERAPPRAGQDTDAALADWGLEPALVATLKAQGVIA